MYSEVIKCMKEPGAVETEVGSGRDMNRTITRFLGS